MVLTRLSLERIWTWWTIISWEVGLIRSAYFIARLLGTSYASSRLVELKSLGCYFFFPPSKLSLRWSSLSQLIEVVFDGLGATSEWCCCRNDWWRSQRWSCSQESGHWHRHGKDWYRRQQRSCRHDPSEWWFPYHSVSVVVVTSPLRVDDDDPPCHIFANSSAIEEGKGIFHNIRNFVRFQLST